MLLKIKKNLHDFDNICQLHLVSSFLILISLIFELLIHDPSVFNVFILLGCIYFLRTYYFSLKKLQYTYWTLTFSFVFFLLFSTSFQTMSASLPLIGFLVLKLVELYFVSSPIFYPWFNWWEYDFRYRNDLKAFVSFGEQSHEARVTDIRRHAACITLFEKLPIGSSIIVSMSEKKNTVALEGKIISVRETTLGRGYSYGVSFSWENELTKEYYTKMKSSWNSSRFKKRRDRIDESNSSLH